VKGNHSPFPVVCIAQAGPHIITLGATQWTHAQALAVAHDGLGVSSGDSG
jgi:hypothetical protein